MLLLPCCSHLCWSMCQSVLPLLLLLCCCYQQNIVAAISPVVAMFFLLLLSLLILVTVVCNQCATQLPLLTLVDCWGVRYFLLLVVAHATAWSLHFMPICHHDCQLIIAFPRKDFLVHCCNCCTRLLQMQLSLYTEKCYVPSYNLNTCLLCAVASSLVNCCLLFPTCYHWCCGHCCCLPPSNKLIDHCYPSLNFVELLYPYLL